MLNIACSVPYGFLAPVLYPEEDAVEARNPPHRQRQHASLALYPGGLVQIVGRVAVYFFLFN